MILLRVKILFLFVFALGGCQTYSLKIDDFSAIEGTWRHVDSPDLMEKWRFDSLGQRYIGQTIRVSEKDTQELETIYIFKENDLFWYGADVPENEGITFFSLTSHTEGKWLFQNLEHDFPTHIEYTVKKDTLLASVWNAKRVLSFSMVKID